MKRKNQSKEEEEGHGWSDFGIKLFTLKHAFNNSKSFSTVWKLIKKSRKVSFDSDKHDWSISRRIQRYYLYPNKN